MANISGNCRYKFRNYNWCNDWLTTLSGANAQVGSSISAVCARIKTPAANPAYDNYTKKTVTINAKWKPIEIFQGFTLYAKVYTTDPTTKASDFPPTSAATASWKFTAPKDAGYQEAEMTLTLDPDKTYYVLFWSNATKHYPEFSSTWMVTYDIDGWNDGSVSTPAISDLGNNTYKITSTITGGSNNAFKSAIVYYTTNGNDPTIVSSKVAYSSSGNTLDVPTSKASYTAKAMIVATFEKQSITSSISDGTTIKYYTNGTAPIDPTINLSTTSNTFTISGKTGKGGSSNPITKSEVLYVISNSAGAAVASATLNLEVTSNEATYTTSAIDIPWSGKTDDASNTYTIEAKARCSFGWGTKTLASNMISETGYYRSVISNPTVSITDNGNNTFTITGTDAAKGINNTATTTYTWGYDGSYTNGGTGTVSNKALTLLSTNGAYNNTRLVRAKAVATPSWAADTIDHMDTAQLYINQYVGPGDPGKPFIDYKKSRFTLKETWPFKWNPATATNSVSPIKGYRVRLYINGKTVQIREANGKVVGGMIDLGSSYGDRRWVYDRELQLTDKQLVMPLDPTVQRADDGASGRELKPGDTIQLGLFAYTTDAKGNKIWSGNGSQEVFSDIYTIKNAGIVHIKVNDDWQEGQVYIKVNDAWQEAESVYVKVSDTWCEST